MREIKFRAWDGEKVFHYLHLGEYGVGYYEYKESPENLKLMQYTGLKDKNGKEIYEGDIVQSRNGKKGYYQVVWYDSGFKLKYSFIRKYEGNFWTETKHLPIYADSYVVVGNIYENHELMEVAGI